MLSTARTTGNSVPDTHPTTVLMADAARITSGFQFMNFRALTFASLSFALALPRLWAETPAELAAAQLRELTKGETCGVAVLVARDGQIVFQGGYGYADLAQKTPITPETKFRIGSVTKQFTAAAILKLAEQEKLAITDLLAKFYPEFPNAGAITLRHLLTHTSGLHSYTDKPNFLAGVRAPIAPADLIASFQKDPPDFAPGASFRYCNSAYFLLGEIVAKVSGQSLADYLRGTFFEPLGMKDTGIFVNATPPPGMALGYAMQDGKTEPALDWDMSWAGGAGALYSTVGDLFRWNEALYGGRVGNAASLKAMTTPNPLPPGADGLNYGYGLAISELRQLPMISHAGGLHGWSSDLLRLPEQRCTVVALANAMPPPRGLEPAAVTRALAERFLAGDIAQLPPLAVDQAVDPKSYATFAGRYDYQSAILTVTVENDRLFAQLTGQQNFEIFPKSADEFFWKVTDARVRFLRDDKGKVVAAQHTQGGNTFKAARLAADAVQLTPEQLDFFVGQYQYGPAAVLTVIRDGTQLFAQLTGQPRMPIFPTAADSFEWRVVEAQVRFVKGEDGKVAKAVHRQNGVTFDAPKVK
jgi:CubicO group peptidase (beta-lactamase class C family)